MAYHPTNLSQIMLAKQGAWGTAATPTASNANLVECEVVLPTLTQEALTTEALRGQFHAHRTIAGSKEGVSVSVKMPLHGWSSATPSGNPGAGDVFVDSILMEYALGGVEYGAVGYGQDPGSATVNVYGMTDGTAFAPGYACLVKTSGQAYSYGAAFVASVSSNDVTWHTAVAGASADANVYGAINTYLTSTTPTVPLTMVYLGDDTTNKIVLYDGLVTSVKITAAPKGQPTLEATIQFINWTLSGSGGGVSQYTYGLPLVPVTTGANGARYAHGGGTGSGATEKSVANAEFEVAISYAPVMSHGSDQGVSQYVITNREVTLTTEEPLTAVNGTTVAAPGTEITNGIQLDLSTVPGRACSILIPKAQQQELATLGDSDGIVSASYVYAPIQYTADGGSSGPNDTLVRVAFL
jgi:hypothetical protein